MRLQSIIKLVSLIGTIGFIGSVLLLNPPGAYFTSLYSVFPIYTWLFFAFGIGGSVLLIISSAPYGERTWVFGVGCILGVYLVFLSLPQFLGLRFWAPPSGDMFIHFAHIEYVTKSAQAHESSTYPTIQMFFAILVATLGIPVEWTNHLTAIYTGLFIAGITLYSRELSQDKTVGICVLAIAFALVFERFHYPIMPWFASFVLLPFTLHTFTRVLQGGRIEWRIATLALLVGSVLQHPMTGVIIIFIISVIYIIYKFQTIHTHGNGKLAIPYSTIIAGIIYLIFFLDLSSVQNYIQIIVVGFLGGGTGTVEYATGGGISSYTIPQLVWEWVILRYGVLLLVLGTASVLTLALLGLMVKKRQTRTDIVVMITLFYLGIGFAITQLFFNLGATPPHRINQLSFLGAILIIGFSLSRFLECRHDAVIYRRAAIAMVVIVCLATVGSGGYVFNHDRHMIESEIVGVEHSVVYEDRELMTVKHSTPNKVEHYLLGVSEFYRIAWDDQIFHDGPEHQPPNRLGYDQYDSVGEAFNETVYLHTVDRDIEYVKDAPDNRLEYLDHYTEADRERLSVDRQAIRIYDNERHQLWLVNQ